MVLAIGLSPCPNDTFIFHAMLSGLVEGPKVHWQPHLEDVETLNERALNGEYPVTKLSFHAYAYASRHYQLLDAGSALGFGCGPLFIMRPDVDLRDLSKLRVAVPGRLTTAHFLLMQAFPMVQIKEFIPFSEIEDAILDGSVDAGVIIHENRFTYGLKGLQLIQDLGAYWENTTHHPIPLGGIAIKRDLPEQLKKEINACLAASIRYAWAHPEASAQYVKEHAQEMDPEVRKKHIALYVNRFSEHLGDEGRNAVSILYQRAVENKVLDSLPQNIFLN